MKKDRIFFIIILILLVVNLILTFLSIENNKSLNEYIQKNEMMKNNDLLSRDIAWRNVDGFIQDREDYNLSYFYLKREINLTIQNTNGFYGVYLEDLNTGASIGINEKEPFITASLLKIPIMMMILKKVENGELYLDQKIRLKEKNLNSESGELYRKGAGYEIKIRDLIIELMQNSDNTAANTLLEYTDEKDFNNVLFSAELPTFRELDGISPKHYSNFLRTLYYSTYLKPSFSQLALSNMIDTKFNSQIPAKIPPEIKIAHKVGFNDNLKVFHDCGIIYIPNNPYILCVMSRNSTLEESNKVISEISRMIFEFSSKRKITN